ncbi:hypothetical protein [Arthrobacter cavernae]|uniref:Uncharacterized protein n=1 Tax=Arthrobacter cavernae TaxID=2817681 RepID=A0A939HFW6_9MICC|nr:hypothetical protein [Arthrobacter cavernae]MBO1269166.1 hypothetical protein [Arthrobacter cavernae]
MIENLPTFRRQQMQGPSDPDRPETAPANLTMLRLQVLEIISSVLEDQEPGKEDVQARMRLHLADNPGRPELALLAQLMDRYTPETP